jgi:hypothetical protein
MILKKMSLAQRLSQDWKMVGEYYDFFIALDKEEASFRDRDKYFPEETDVFLWSSSNNLVDFVRYGSTPFLYSVLHPIKTSRALKGVNRVAKDYISKNKS